MTEKGIGEIIDSKNNNLINEACLNVQNISGYADKVLEHLKTSSIKTILSKKTPLKKLLLLALVHANNVNIMKEHYKLLINNVPEYVLLSILQKGDEDFKHALLEAKSNLLIQIEYKEKMNSLLADSNSVDYSKTSQCLLEKLLFKRLFEDKSAAVNPLEIIFYMKDFERFVIYVEKRLYSLPNVEIFVRNLIGFDEWATYSYVIKLVADIPSLRKKIYLNETFVDWECPFAFPVCISIGLLKYLFKERERNEFFTSPSSDLA
jgi:hypothetical protein